MAEALVRSVIQVDMRNLDPGFVQRLRVDGEAVVLRGDLDLAGQKILDRVVPPAMTEFQLEGLPTQSQSNELMTEADAEDRLLADKSLDVLNGNSHCRGISGSVREKNPVRIEFQDLFGVVGCRHDRHSTAVPYKPAQNIPLDAEVVRDDVEFDLLGTCDECRKGKRSA